METEISDAKPLAGRVALVTGASRGIGAAAAKRLAAAGAHCVLVARTVGGLEEVDDAISAAGGSATLVVQDLTDFQAIDRLGAALYERYGKLDILLGNAGALGVLSPVGHIAPKVWEETFQTNVTVNFRLIRAMDPLLRQAEAGRAIFLTSGATRNLRPFWSAYAASKAALEAMVIVYARETEKSQVRTNLVDPGRQRTGMRAAAYPGEDPMTLPHPDEKTQVYVDLASPACTKNGEIVSAY